jgi:hypothetical protein
MHAMIPDSVQQAIESGFDGVEHASIVEEEQLEAMASAGITWTPTALIDDVLRDSAEEMLGSVAQHFWSPGWSLMENRSVRHTNSGSGSWRAPTLG